MCIKLFKEKKMKKSLSLIITALILYLTNFTSHAEDFQYTIIDGQATITGFSGEPETLEIPAVIEGSPVTEIRDNAFYKCASLKSVKLPETLEKMGHHCFFECTSLEEISIPDSTTDIGMGCFDGCSSLRKAVLSENLAILPESCFRDCSSLENIIIPQNTAEIQKFCFAGCTSLSGISLSGNLKTIGDLAFFGCNSVGELYIPDSVENIGIRSLGFGEYGRISGFSISGAAGTVSEKYAAENGFPFSANPETADVFAQQKSRYAPVELPEIFLFAGLFFFIMAVISTFRKRRKQ